jgi:hypothetical protein
VNLDEAKAALAQAHEHLVVAAGHQRGAADAYRNAGTIVAAVRRAGVYADALAEVQATIVGTRNLVLAGMEAMGPQTARVGMMAGVVS